MTMGDHIDQLVFCISSQATYLSPSSMEGVEDGLKYVVCDDVFGMKTQTEPSNF